MITISNSAELKDAVETKTLHFVLLTLVTMGIYPLLWLYRYTPVIERITGHSIDNGALVIWISVCVGLNATIPMEEDFAVFSFVFSAVTTMGYVIWAFKARKALELYADRALSLALRMNPIFVVLFNVFYITYYINQLPEMRGRSAAAQTS